MHVSERSQSGWQSGLGNDERDTLYRIALDTLAHCVRQPGVPFAWDGYALTPLLREERASFVTLHQPGGRLRGCIGTLAPVAPLFQSVHDNTVAAALHDPRFHPVQPAELPQLHLTVSILSDPEPIATAEDFLPGKHGIILEKHGRRSVFLPEVADEQGWTRAETLAALCVKAGLPDDAWQSQAQFSIFHTAILSGSGSVA